MVKKCKTLKTLNAVVEYRAHMVCECDGISFDKSFGILKIITSWIRCSPSICAFYCILYVFCMLAEGTFSWMGLPEDDISDHQNTLVTEGDINMMHGTYNDKMPVCSLLRQSKIPQNCLFSVIITWMPTVYTSFKTCYDCASALMLTISYNDL